MKTLYNYILVIAIIITSTFLLVPTDVYAADIVAKTTESVRIRKAPNTSGTIIVNLSGGTTVYLVSTTKTGTINSDCTEGWYQVNYGGSTNRYMCSDFVSITNSTNTNNTYYTTSNYGARTNITTTNIRTSASTASSIKSIVFYGTSLNILSESAAGDGCSSKWYYVSYYNNLKGYVCSSYVTKYANITANDAAYYQVLEDAGFPENYLPFLTYLHNKYPTWTFKAIKTNLNYNDVISGEEGKNYIQSTNNAYRTSSNPAEGSTWFVAKDGVNAFYLDPTNYLNEKTIFAFEKLSYDATVHTASVVKDIFGSSYLSADEYVNYFMTAGTTYNISPVHLASRVRQEGGTVSTYAPITGTSTLTYRGFPLRGYYNYYNIGAHADDYTDNPIARGLAYASGPDCVYNDNGTSKTCDFYNTYGRPWTTRQKAIMGGAWYLANGYISEGQYTMYFEKFQTNPSAGYSLYTHQYMTNVTAPISESISTYSSYSDMGLLNTPFTFSIPVYNNMPSAFTTLPPIGNTNNNLSNIKINGTTINSFDEDVVSYTQYISDTAANIEVTATSSASTSEITGTGTIPITNPTTNINITVTSEAGESKTYTVTIIKVNDTTKTVSQIINEVGVKISSNYVSGISSGTTATTLINSVNKQSPSATVTIKNVSGATKTGTKLATGDALYIKTYSGEESTMTVVIKGDTNGDGSVSIVDLLRVQKHILKSTILKSSYAQAADNNYDGKISIVDLLRVQKHILGSIKLK